MRKGDITAEVVATLVAQQFPQWADLPVAPVELDGWDNTTFRLGDALSVRLPSADIYVPQIEKEHRWLPVLAPQLPVAIPEPVALGEPNTEFPRPWSVYRWIEGDHATFARIDDVNEFACDLAHFLAALYRIDADDGPPGGAHSHGRGAPVEQWDRQTRSSIVILQDEIDDVAARDVWDAALAGTSEDISVWVHGDIAPSNLLVENGRLSAVIDFGCSAVGDPACDLVIAWTFFTGDSRATFQQALPFDDATWARARGWALWKAVITLARERHGGPSADAGAQRAGWRVTTRAVLDAVVADHVEHA